MCPSSYVICNGCLSKYRRVWLNEIIVKSKCDQTEQKYLKLNHSNTLRPKNTKVKKTQKSYALLDQTLWPLVSNFLMVFKQKGRFWINEVDYWARSNILGREIVKVISEEDQRGPKLEIHRVRFMIVFNCFIWINFQVLFKFILVLLSTL